MVHEEKMIAFGPVPSRRLGQSLGINNIPLKTCTYSCIYCQLGRTNTIQIQQEAFYQPEKIKYAVKNKINEIQERGEPVDYLTFVPDGEPTLNVNLGKEIDLLKPLGIKTAVITNSSLLWMENVRNDLYKADWVSLKIDGICQSIWRKINRPQESLMLERVLKSIEAFSREFNGELVTETMLLRDINDDTKEIEKVADYISMLYPYKSYISIPTRPPTEKWVSSASEFELNLAYQIFKERGLEPEYLIGYEGNAYAYTGNIEEDLLSITSVHPMREDGVANLLSKAKAGWDIIEKLIKKDKLVEMKYKGKTFYIRKLPGQYQNNAGRWT